jgi:hypothetical protein
MTGQVIGRISQKLLALLQQIKYSTPAGLDLHVILDNRLPPTKLLRSSSGWKSIRASIALHTDQRVMTERHGRPVCKAEKISAVPDRLHQRLPI